MAGFESIVTYSFLFVTLYFEVFLLITFLEKKLQHVQRTSTNDNARLPRVAVIVPCFNEETTVAETISSLLRLKYPCELLQIIAVDDGSTDRTLDILRSFENNPIIRTFSKPNGGKHTAMNYALERTDAELIASLDADSFVHPDALMHIVPVFDNPRVAAVTPGIHVKDPQTMLQHIQRVEYMISIFNRFIFSTLGSAFITPGPFSVFRSSVVRALGGWQYGHSTEDMELALRIQAAGYLIGNAPRAHVETVTPRTLRQLFRQRVRWTYGFLRNAADYRHMFMNSTYGNLGMIVLPIALVSVAAVIYFFLRLLWFGTHSLLTFIDRYNLTGTLPHPTIKLFYMDTSAMLFVIYLCIIIVLALISIGSWIGTGSRRLPLSTPLFVALYCFIAPLWLCTALFRAAFRTNVRWR